MGCVAATPVSIGAIVLAAAATGSAGVVSVVAGLAGAGAVEITPVGADPPIGKLSAGDDAEPPPPHAETISAIKKGTTQRFTSTTLKLPNTVSFPNFINLPHWIVLIVGNMSCNIH